MVSDLESDTSSSLQAEAPRSRGWLKLAAVAAASALVGGLAAAWWYRSTLQQLRLAEETPSNPDFRIPGEDSSDES